MKDISGFAETEGGGGATTPSSNIAITLGFITKLNINVAIQGA